MQAQRLSFTEAKNLKVAKITATVQHVMRAKLAARPHERGIYSACVDVWLEVGKRIMRCTLSEVMTVANAQRDFPHGDNHTLSCQTPSSTR